MNDLPTANLAEVVRRELLNPTLELVDADAGMALQILQAQGVLLSSQHVLGLIGGCSRYGLLTSRTEMHQMYAGVKIARHALSMAMEWRYSPASLHDALTKLGNISNIASSSMANALLKERT